MAIQDLPDELLQQILIHVPPQDILANVQLVSRRFQRLSREPLIWRYHCVNEFRYWDERHLIRQKCAGLIGEVDWRKLFQYRLYVDHRTSYILDSILSAQIGRIKKFEQIGEFGYDAKDTLLRHCRTSADAEDVEDVLARRFYSNAVLDYVHRAKAVAEWYKLSKGEDVALERALGSFDMFVIHDQQGDLQEISDIFVSLVRRLREEYTNLDEMSQREKAIAAVQFLRAENLTGIASELAYRDLQNNYIGIALQDDEHPSLPLISVAIYCVLAQRLNLQAHPCGFPNHVHALVYLSDESVSGDNDRQRMYLDPYRSDREIPVESLITQLTAWGIRQGDFSKFLGASQTSNIVLRTSRNILATVHEFRGMGGDAQHTGHPTIRLHANPFADMDNAFYSALWANFILSARNPGSIGNNQRQFVPMILERFERLYPVDAALIERYVLPPFQEASARDHIPLYETLHVVRTADATPKQSRPRDTEATQKRVKYKVGQVFRHRRYGYHAVITGWDVECGMNSQWIVQNNVDALSKGRHQSFYHALVEDTSIRYVAEENVEIIEPEVPFSLMTLAGRYFKRWDNETHTFVSNVRDEYPDD